MFALEYLMDYTLANMGPVQVSIWNGYVMGGGVGISINSKIRIATEKTMFAMPETAIGFYPDVGASHFFTRPHIIPEIGLYMALTGHRLKGKELVDWGFATHYMDA